jgi:hypothetical protein
MHLQMRLVVRLLGLQEQQLMQDSVLMNYKLAKQEK